MVMRDAMTVEKRILDVVVVGKVLIGWYSKD